MSSYANLGPQGQQLISEQLYKSLFYYPDGIAGGSFNLEVPGTSANNIFSTQILSQSVPTSAPALGPSSNVLLPGTQIVAGSKQTATQYPYIIKYTNLQLAATTPSVCYWYLGANATYSPSPALQVTNNLLNYGIPSNYDPAGGYQQTIQVTFNNVNYTCGLGNSLFPWVYNVNSGIVEFTGSNGPWSGTGIPSNNQPPTAAQVTFTFWRYDPAVGGTGFPQSSASVDFSTLGTNYDYTDPLFNQQQTTFTPAPSALASSASGQYQTLLSGNIIRYSTDFGQSWSSNTVDSSGTSVAISATGQYQLVATVNKTLYSSTNGGSSFLTNHDASASAVAISGNGQFWTTVTSGPSGGLFYSINAGLTFTNAGLPPNNFRAVAMSSSGQYQTAIAANHLYTTSNSAKLWTDTSFSAVANFTAISMSSSGQFQVALTDTSGGNALYLSSNYGSTWTPNASVTGPGTSVAVSATGQYMVSIANSQLQIFADFGQNFINPSSPPTATPKLVTISSSGQFINVTDASGHLFISEAALATGSITMAKGSTLSSSIGTFDTSLEVGNNNNVHMDSSGITLNATTLVCKPGLTPTTVIDTSVNILGTSFLLTNTSYGITSDGSLNLNPSSANINAYSMTLGTAGNIFTAKAGDVSCNTLYVANGINGTINKVTVNPDTSTASGLNVVFCKNSNTLYQDTSGPFTFQPSNNFLTVGSATINGTTNQFNGNAATATTATDASNVYVSTGTNNSNLALISTGLKTTVQYANNLTFENGTTFKFGNTGSCSITNNTNNNLGTFSGNAASATIATNAVHANDSSYVDVVTYSDDTSYQLALFSTTGSSQQAYAGWSFQYKKTSGNNQPSYAFGSLADTVTISNWSMLSLTTNTASVLGNASFNGLSGIAYALGQGSFNNQNLTILNAADTNTIQMRIANSGPGGTYTGGPAPNFIFSGTKYGSILNAYVTPVATTYSSDYWSAFLSPAVLSLNSTYNGGPVGATARTIMLQMSTQPVPGSQWGAGANFSLAASGVNTCFYLDLCAWKSVTSGTDGSYNFQNVLSFNTNANGSQSSFPMVGQVNAAMGIGRTNSSTSTDQLQIAGESSNQYWYFASSTTTGRNDFGFLSTVSGDTSWYIDRTGTFSGTAASVAVNSTTPSGSVCVALFNSNNPSVSSALYRDTNLTYSSGALSCNISGTAATVTVVPFVGSNSYNLACHIGTTIYDTNISYDGSTLAVPSALAVNTTQCYSYAPYGVQDYFDVVGSGNFLSFNNSNILSLRSGLPTQTGPATPIWFIDQSGNFNGTSFTSTSDHRIKENVQPLDDSFTVDQLRPVHYDNTKSGRHDIGLIAHEVEEVYPFLVHGTKDDPDQMQSLNYNGLIGLLVKEVQRLKADNSRLQDSYQGLQDSYQGLQESYQNLQKAFVRSQQDSKRLDERLSRLERLL